jgi:hypothetical protein
MKNIITLSIVALILSIFSAQYAMAASTAEVVDAAVQKSTKAEREKIEANHQEFAATGGKIVVGRDGSVRVVPNGPTIGQRVYLAGAYVKDGVVYAAVKSYNGAKAADGAIAGFVTYPVAKLGEWMNRPAAQTVAVETPVGTASVSVTPAK